MAEGQLRARIEQYVERTLFHSHKDYRYPSSSQGKFIKGNMYVCLIDEHDNGDDDDDAKLLI